MSLALNEGKLTVTNSSYDKEFKIHCGVLATSGTMEQCFDERVLVFDVSPNVQLAHMRHPCHDQCWVA